MHSRKSGSSAIALSNTGNYVLPANWWLPGSPNPEQRNGDRYNLVLLSNASAKTHIKSSETHKYAADHLSHSYYEWIRLHKGVMPEGLDHMEMQLQKTKYYTLQVGEQRPSIREMIYETARGAARCATGCSKVI